jgi:hypothetical protein
MSGFGSVSTDQEWKRASLFQVELGGHGTPNHGLPPFRGKSRGKICEGTGETFCILILVSLCTVFVLIT